MFLRDAPERRRDRRLGAEAAGGLGRRFRGGRGGGAAREARRGERTERLRLGVLRSGGKERGEDWGVWKC